MDLKLNTASDSEPSEPDSVEVSEVSHTSTKCYIHGYYQYENVFIDADDKEFALEHGVIPVSTA